MRSILFRGAAVAALLFSTGASFHCGGGDDTASGDATDAGAGGGDGSSLSQDGGPGGGGPDGSSAPPGPKSLAYDFAQLLPTNAGTPVATPDGWIVPLLLFGGTTLTIGGTALPVAGVYDVGIVKFDGKGTPQWATLITGDGDDRPSDVVVDEAGNIYVSGTSLGANVDFGQGIVLDGDPDIRNPWSWYAKLDATGKPKWAKRLLANLGQGAIRLAYGSGRLAVAGEYTGTNMTYPTSTGEAVDPVYFGRQPQIYVASCAPADGNVTWHTLYGNAEASVQGLGVAADGNVVVAGTFGGGDLQDRTKTQVLGKVNGVPANTFVAALDATGTQKWIRGFGTTSPNGVSLVGLSAGTKGTLVTSGEFSGSADFGHGTRTAAKDFAPFVVALDPTTGAPLWDKELTPFGSPARWESIAASAAGDVYVTIVIESGAVATTIDQVTLPTKAGTYLAKLSSAGSLLWVNEQPVGAGQPAIAAGSGHVALVGTFRGTLTLGGVTVASPDASNDYAWFFSAIADGP